MHNGNQSLLCVYFRCNKRKYSFCWRQNSCCGVVHCIRYGVFLSQLKYKTNRMTRNGRVLLHTWNKSTDSQCDTFAIAHLKTVLLNKKKKYFVLQLLPHRFFLSDLFFNIHFVSVNHAHTKRETITYFWFRTCSFFLVGAFVKYKRGKNMGTAYELFYICTLYSI